MAGYDRTTNSSSPQFRTTSEAVICHAPRHGVVTLFGYGIQVRVIGGHRELSSQRSDRLEKQVLRHILQYRETDTTFCAFCLSENKNLLSQWRGYCPREGGYSLGFSAEAMQPHLQQQGYTLERCEYNRESQCDRVNRLLNTATKDFQENDPGQGAVSERAKQIVPRFICALSRVAATLKHPAYIEEQEWRIISNGSVSIAGLDYRIRGSVAIPHSTLSLKDGFPLAKIVVGPSSNQRLAVGGLRALLHRHGIEDPDIIERSEIPYRPLC